MHPKVDWVRKISHVSNLQTRMAPRHTKNIFMFKTYHVIYRWKGFFTLILKIIMIWISKRTGSVK